MTSTIKRISSYNQRSYGHKIKYNIYRHNNKDMIRQLQEDKRHTTNKKRTPYNKDIIQLQEHNMNNLNKEQYNNITDIHTNKDIHNNKGRETYNPRDRQ